VTLIIILWELKSLGIGEVEETFTLRLYFHLTPDSIRVRNNAYPATGACADAAIRLHSRCALDLWMHLKRDAFINPGLAG